METGPFYLGKTPLNLDADVHQVRLSLPADRECFGEHGPVSFLTEVLTMVAAVLIAAAWTIIIWGI